MSILTWIEDTEGSRSASIGRLGRRMQSSYIKRWKLFGTSDDLVAHADVSQTLWQQYLFWQYPGQPLNQLHLESYTLEYLGDKAYQLEATYTSMGGQDDENQDPLKRSRTFDTGGATQHVTQAIPSDEFPSGEHRFHSGSPAAPNMFGAIGVDGDSVAGVDIVVPQLTWNETYDVPTRFVTTQYIAGLSQLTGTVNNATFRGFAAGEVLFLGCNGSQQWDEQKGDGPWTLSYKFLASPNAGPGQSTAALKIGDIEDIQKDGHDYLWVRYEDAIDNDTLLKRPKFVYVDKVYRRVDFSSLGIGT